MIARSVFQPLSLAAAASLAACSGAERPGPDSPVFTGQPGARHIESARPLADSERFLAKADKIERRGPKPYDEPDKAMDFFLRQRLAPGMDEYPVARVQQAARDIRAREAADLRTRSTTIGGFTSWDFVGPGNIGGRTRALVINPVNPNIMYAAGVAGGVWKTTNAGASWTPTSDFLANIAVVSLAMDPDDPGTLYAGTGEGFYGSGAVRGLGIFKTTDAGLTWNQLPGTVNASVPEGAFYRVNDIVFSDSGRLYAATRFGVWRSEDDGQTWQARICNPFQTLVPGVVSSQGCFVGFTDLAVHTENGVDTVFAAAGSFYDDGLYRSTNSGQTWTRVSSGQPIGTTDQGRISIDIAPSDPNIVYAVVASNGSYTPTGTVKGVFRSNDGGVSWEARSVFDLPIDSTADVLLSNPLYSDLCYPGYGLSSQGWHDIIIKIDPVDPDTVWVGGIDLFRSSDAGATWDIASHWWIDSTYDQFNHADHHALVFHPGYDGVNNRTLYSGSDGGVYRTDNALAPLKDIVCLYDEAQLGAVAWTSLNNGYGVTQFYHGDISADANVFLGGAQDNGSSIVSGRYNENKWDEVFGGDGGYCAVSKSNPSTFYVQTQYYPRIRKTTNGGASFAFVADDINDNLVPDEGGATEGMFITPFAMDPNDSNTLWTGGVRPWRTTNGAASWTLAGPDFSGQDYAGPNNISAIAVALGDPAVVLLGFEDGFVARSDNARDPTPTWTVAGPGQGLPDEAYISGVAIDPSNHAITYATVSTFGVPHIYRSTNAGLSWQPIGDGIEAQGVPDVPVHCLAVHPCRPAELYAGTEIGVFASNDAGASWRPLNTGLANTVVEQLTFTNDGASLAAFTYGRGAFITDLFPCGFNCPADLTTTHANPGEPGRGVADGNIDGADLSYYVELWITRNPDADLTTTGANPGNPYFGFPDGYIDGTDISYYVESWITGCF